MYPPRYTYPTRSPSTSRGLVLTLLCAGFLFACSLVAILGTLLLLGLSNWQDADTPPAWERSTSNLPAVQTIDAATKQAKARREKAISLRNEAGRLEQQQNWNGAIEKWRASQGYAADARVDERIRQLQERVEQSNTRREKAIALRNEAAEREQQQDWAGAIEKWRASQSYVADYRVEARIAELQGRVDLARVQREKAVALRNEAADLEQRQDWTGAIEKWQASLKYVADERVNARIAELQARVQLVRAEAQRRAEEQQRALEELTRAEEARAKKLEEETRAMLQAAAERERLELQKQREEAARLAAQREEQRLAAERERQRAEAARLEAERRAQAEAAERERQRLASLPPQSNELAGTWNGSYTYGSANPLRLVIEPLTTTTCRITITLQVFGSNQTLAPAVVSYNSGVFSANIDGRTFAGQVKRAGSGLTVDGQWSWKAMGVSGTWRASKG